MLTPIPPTIYLPPAPNYPRLVRVSFSLTGDFAGCHDAVWLLRLLPNPVAGQGRPPTRRPPPPQPVRGRAFPGRSLLRFRSCGRRPVPPFLGCRSRTIGRHEQHSGIAEEYCHRRGCHLSLSRHVRIAGGGLRFHTAADRMHGKVRWQEDEG